MNKVGGWRALKMEPLQLVPWRWVIGGKPSELVFAEVARWIQRRQSPEAERVPAGPALIGSGYEEAVGSRSGCERLGQHCLVGSVEHKRAPDIHSRG